MSRTAVSEVWTVSTSAQTSSQQQRADMISNGHAEPIVLSALPLTGTNSLH